MSFSDCQKTLKISFKSFKSVQLARRIPGFTATLLSKVKHNRSIEITTIISYLDGRMFGILPVLMGWIFLSLYSKCPQAKSVFLTVEDMLSSLYDNSEEDPVLLETISNLFKVNRKDIEVFLKKLMPSQPNLEEDLGFRYEEAKIVDSLYEKINQNLVIDENDMPSDLKYFEAKWSNTSATAIVLDNLQFYLPVPLFSSLCTRFSLQPAAPEDLNKRLKLAESMLLKPIKAGKDSTASSVLAPTDDYTKFESKLRPEKAKNSKFAVVGNTSMLSFFKKAT